MLGICVRTAQLWVEQGRLRAWKTPGGHRRILRESIAAELRSREKACGAGEVAFDVLVVEDDRVLRQMMQSKLASVSREISVRTAYNGVEGLIKIGERQPQVLITDLLMPGLDGFHLLSTLTTSPLIRAMQIIAVTGLADSEIEAQGGLPEGVVLFRKPVRLPELMAVVRAYFNGWSLQHKTQG